jgi:hypothetical protein
MLFKIILVFLGAMVLVAMIGKALFPGRLSRMLAKRRKPAVCTKCGRPLIGTKGCDCGKGAR